MIDHFTAQDKGEWTKMMNGFKEFSLKKKKKKKKKNF